MSTPTINELLLPRLREEISRSIAISPEWGILNMPVFIVYCKPHMRIYIHHILLPWEPEVCSQELSRLLLFPIHLFKFQWNSKNLTQRARSGWITYNSTLRVCLINVLSHIFHILWDSGENCWEEPICSCVPNYAFSVKGGKAFSKRLQLHSWGRRPGVCCKQLNTIEVPDPIVD